MSMIRLILFGVVALAPQPSLGCTQSALLDGTVAIAQCDPDDADGCIPGGQAIFDALEALDEPGEFSIGLQTSPWRMYDAGGRIITIDEIASLVRAQRPAKDKRVRLVGSWTSAMPYGTETTLAQRLSTALDGFPVDGSDGFLWLSPEGALRTTRQANSVWKFTPYSVPAGEDVMVAFVPGALAQLEDRFASDGLADGVAQAGVGHDAFGLCPERALAAFERAAVMGSGIGAYNAGLMYAEAGDRQAATKWLEKAASLGEWKARAVLASLSEESKLNADE